MALSSGVLRVPSASLHRGVVGGGTVPPPPGVQLALTDAEQWPVAVPSLPSLPRLPRQGPLTDADQGHLALPHLPQVTAPAPLGRAIPPPLATPHLRQAVHDLVV